MFFHKNCIISIRKYIKLYNFHYNNISYLEFDLKILHKDFIEKKIKTIRVFK